MPDCAIYGFDSRDYSRLCCDYGLLLQFHPDFRIPDINGYAGNHERRAVRHVVEVPQLAILHLDYDTIAVDENDFAAFYCDVMGGSAQCF